MSSSTAKQQRTHPTYEVLYHPGIPGRGEFIRLAFEAAGVPYTDLANEKEDGPSEVQRICMNDGTESDAGNPPVFAPPALRVKDGAKVLVISQTPNVLNYLGPRISMAGDEDKEEEAFWVAQLALTALDLNNEVHDTHPPLKDPQLYYEDQKEESLRSVKGMREARLPKYFSYFLRMLQHNAAKGGEGKYMVGSKLTYADTTVWQVLDGLFFAFPKEMAVRRGEYKDLLEGFYGAVREEKRIKEYLGSARRKEYSVGIFRYYPELDRQE